MSPALSAYADPSLDLAGGHEDDSVPQGRHLIALNALADIARGELPMGATASGHAMSALQDVIDHEFNDRMVGLPDVQPNPRVARGAALRGVLADAQRTQTAESRGIHQQAACLAIQRELQAWRDTPHADAVARALGSLALNLGVADGLVNG
jgi:hypothetical protein